MKIQFSVIIPLYNKEDYIISTIKSVLNQTYNNYEIIVIDDNSIDSSFKKVNDFIIDYKIENIKLYKNKENRGVSFSRNEGINRVNGNYIVFLDADDEIKDKNFFNEVSKSIIKYQAEYIVVTRDYYGEFIKPKIKGKQKEIEKLEQNFYHITDKAKFAYKYTFPFGGSGSAILSKSALKNYTFNINEKNFEDWDFFFKIYIENDSFFLSKPYIKVNDVKDSLSKIKEESDKHWEIPTFYNTLKEKKLTKLRKKFYWIWLVSKIKKEKNKDKIKEKLQFQKKEMIENKILTKHYIYFKSKLLLEKVIN